MSKFIFIYRNQKYPINLKKKNSNYFLALKPKIKENTLINLLDEFDSLQSLSEDSIQTFFNYCQNKRYTITNSNALQIYYLSKKFQVQSLMEEAEEKIRSNHQKIIYRYLMNESQPKKNEVIKPIRRSKSNIPIDKKTKEVISDSNDNDDNGNDDSNNDDNDKKDDDFNKITKPQSPKSLNNENKFSKSYTPKRLREEDNTDEGNSNEYDKSSENDKDIEEKKSDNKNRKKIKNKKRIIKGKKIIKKDLIKEEKIKITDEIKAKIRNREINIPDIIEDIISDNFIDYAFDEYDILSSFPLSTLYHIIKKISKKEEAKAKTKEEEVKIISFLFEYVAKNNIESTVLLTILDFSLEGIEFFNRQLDLYNQYLDMNYLTPKLLQNMRLMHQQLKDNEMKELELSKSQYNLNIEKSDKDLKKLTKEINLMNQKQESRIKTLEGFITTMKEQQQQFEKQIGFLISALSRIDQIKKKHENEIARLNNQIKIQDDQINIQEKRLKDQENQLKNQKDQFKNLENIINEQKLIILTNINNNMQIPRSIQDHLFTRITFPTTLKTIERELLSNCSFVKEIIIPSSIKKIEENAFSRCSSLTKVIIPDSVEQIKSNAFNGCENLVHLTINLNKAKIEEDSFINCSLLHHLTITATENFISENNYHQLFRTFGNITEITIPSTIKELRNNCFKGCSSIKQINIPYSVTTICCGAFSGCSSLTQIEIPNLIKEIKDDTFNGCSSLNNFIIPNSVTKIGNNSFKGCSSLKEIIIPSSVTSIGDYAFSECSSLTEMKIPVKVNKIGSFAFNKCSNISQITINIDETEYDKANSFNKCSSLHHLILATTKEKIEQNDLSRHLKSIGNITKVTITQTIKEICDYAFSECSSLKEITISDSVNEIGLNAFDKCSSLTKVTLPNSIKNINVNTFNECSFLAEIVIPDSVTGIWNGAFNECKSLTQITLPNSLKHLGSYVFKECTKLTEITLPPTLELIGGYNFKNQLKNNNFSIEIELLKKSVFFLCSSLKKVKIDGVEIDFDKCVDIGDYEIKENISLSHVSKVYKVVKEGTQKMLVAKTIPLFFYKDQKKFLELMNSISKIDGVIPIKGYHLPLTKEEHESICKDVYDFSFGQLEGHSNEYIIFTDFMNNGTIEKANKEYIESGGCCSNMDQTTRRKIIFGVAAIMKKLHKFNITNIDLSESNIYLDERNNPKIVSISVSRKYESDSFILKDRDFAQEIISNNNDNQGYMPQSDVYSFGTFLYRMFSTKILYSNSKKVGNDEFPLKPPNIPDNYWELIQQCWLINPFERPSFDEIVQTLKEENDDDDEENDDDEEKDDKDDDEEKDDKDEEEEFIEQSQ